MTFQIKVPKKLIEVALPLDAINIASGREKSIRHGHPSTLHLWWARRPLAASRAVIFAQMVNDPGYERNLGRGVNKEQAQKEREKLFNIIEQLVRWENSNNEPLLKEARAEILKSWQETCALNAGHPNAKVLFNPEQLPAFHDPFAGGGSIPSEAQRLGLNSFASDLNPVAVLINKAMIEIPPKFAGSPPIGPMPRDREQQDLETSWPRSTGLAEDVFRYGNWLRDEAQRRIGNCFPRVKITKELAGHRPDLKDLVGKDAEVTAWIWAKTVKSPNPKYSNVDVPLVSSFVLSAKEGAEVFIQPKILESSYCFEVKSGPYQEALSLGTRSGKAEAFSCIMSKTPIDRKYIQTEGKAGRMGVKLMAVVISANRKKIYLEPTKEIEDFALSFNSNEVVLDTRSTVLSGATPTRAMITGGVCSAYGIKTWGDLFTGRQILALSTFSDLVNEVRSKITEDFQKNGGDSTRAKEYADSIATFLGFGVSRASDYWSANATWVPSGGFIRNVFGKQALPMVWDYAEANPFSDGTGSWLKTCLDWIVRVIREFNPQGTGSAVQAAAQDQNISHQKIVSTDPPYYNNISYAVLADYFYAWLKRSLSPVYPELLEKTYTPKDEELIANVARHETKEKADSFFLSGMTDAFTKIANDSHPGFPVTIYYAYKQTETAESGKISTGWESFLDATMRAGFSITGTWPIRTERSNRPVATDKNALASSIVLVCRRKSETAGTISRREFIRELNAALPVALEEMTQGGDHSPVAPVDLSQAIIGPGMAIFSKYSAVLEADGKPMSVRTALQLINRFLAEDDFDHDTQFCIQWFEANGWNSGKFGDADVLARAKGTSVEGLRDGGTVESSAGRLRLLKPSELPAGWRPETDTRVSIWEILHYMIMELNVNGEAGAGEILARANSVSETVRALAYRLYTLCERRGWAQDAGSYDSLVRAWDSIESAARSVGYSGTQIPLFGAEQAEASKPEPKKKTRKKT